MTAPGLELALRIEADKLRSIDRVLLNVRNVFDCDESNTNFEIRHNPWCPDSELVGTDHRGTCACGILSTLRDLKDACRDMEQVRDGLERCIRSLAKETVRS